MEEIPASEFEGRDFSARDLVQRYRKRLPLTQLQKALTGHQEATQRELVELINEKYADFVSLSSRMQGVERALRPLQAPLEDSRETTGSLRDRLGGLMEQADEAHRTLSRIQRRKGELEAFQSNAKLLERAREAAKQWGNPQEADAVQQHTAHENISRDLRKLRLELAAAEAPECQALLREAEDFEKSFAEGLQAQLHGLVSAALRAWEPTDGREPGTPVRSELLAIAHVSRALTTLNRNTAVEEAFAKAFVRKSLQAAADATAQTGATTGAVDLAGYFQRVTAELLSETAPLRWMAQRLNGDLESDGSMEAEVERALMAVPSLHLMANAVVLPVLAHIEEIWPNVFIPAFKDVFAANYVHAANFITSASELMGLQERKTFSKSEELLEFQKKWKTQFYAQLRAKEARERLEQAIGRVSQWNADPLKGPQHAAGEYHFWLELSGELLQTLRLSWSNGWYLDSLYSKTLQLSLELVDRYGEALRSLASVPSSADWEEASIPPAWAPASAPARLPLVASDLLQVIAELRCANPGLEDVGAVARMALVEAPQGPDAQPGAITRRLLDDAAASLRPVLSDLEAAMQQQISKAASPPFTAVRSIPTMYRMLNKPVPTQASPYVDSALRPIQAFHKAAAGIAPSDAVASWIQQAVDLTAGEFLTQAVQLLDTTKQQEASLRRLAGRGGDAQVSDFDKIHIQLCLDVDAFIEASKVLGAEADLVPGVARLLAAVAPARRAQEQFGGAPAAP